MFRVFPEKRAKKATPLDRVRNCSSILGAILGELDESMEIDDSLIRMAISKQKHALDLVGLIDGAEFLKGQRNGNRDVCGAVDVQSLDLVEGDLFILDIHRQASICPHHGAQRPSE